MPDGGGETRERLDERREESGRRRSEGGVRVRLARYAMRASSRSGTHLRIRHRDDKGCTDTIVVRVVWSSVGVLSSVAAVYCIVAAVYCQCSLFQTGFISDCNGSNTHTCTKRQRGRRIENSKEYVCVGGWCAMQMVQLMSLFI